MEKLGVASMGVGSTVVSGTPAPPRKSDRGALEAEKGDEAEEAMESLEAGEARPPPKENAQAAGDEGGVGAAGTMPSGPPATDFTSAASLSTPFLSSLSHPPPSFAFSSFPFASSPLAFSPFAFSLFALQSCPFFPWQSSYASQPGAQLG